MLTIEGKLTGVQTKKNFKDQQNFYANLLSLDGSKLASVRLKSETYAILCQSINETVSLPVYCNVFNNTLYFNEA